MAWEATTHITQDIALLKDFVARDIDAMYFKGTANQGLIISQYLDSR